MCALIREYREKAGLTQDELADLMNDGELRLHKSQIGKIERGERRLDVFELVAICEALGVGLADFWHELKSRAKA